MSHWPSSAGACAPFCACCPVRHAVGLPLNSNVRHHNQCPRHSQRKLPSVLGRGAYQRFRFRLSPSRSSLAAWRQVGNGLASSLSHSLGQLSGSPGRYCASPLGFILSAAPCRQRLVSLAGCPAGCKARYVGMPPFSLRSLSCSAR
jgi:hypothetical protein